MAMPFQKAQTYIRSSRTKSKQVTQYSIAISKAEMQTQMFGLMESLKKIQAYYEKYDLQFEYNIEPLVAESGLNVQAVIIFNKKMTSGVSLADLKDVQEKLHFFVGLVEHIKALKDSFNFSQLNLNPSCVVKSGGTQVILTDFLLPINQISSDSELSLWYYAQLAPESLSNNEFSLKSVVWSLGCLLYFIITEEWPFLDLKDQSINQVSAIRKKVLSGRYMKYSDETIQREIFQKIFSDGERLTFDQLIEVSSIFLIGGNEIKDAQLGSSQINNEISFSEKDSYVEESEFCDSEHEQQQNKQSHGQYIESHSPNANFISPDRPDPDSRSQFKVEMATDPTSKFKTSHLTQNQSSNGAKGGPPMKSSKHQPEESEMSSGEDQELHINSHVPDFELIQSQRSHQPSKKDSFIVNKEQASQKVSGIKNGVIGSDDEDGGMGDFDNIQSVRSSVYQRTDGASEASFREDASYRIQVSSQKVQDHKSQLIPAKQNQSLSSSQLNSKKQEPIGEKITMIENKGIPIKTGSANGSQLTSAKKVESVQKKIISQPQKVSQVPFNHAKKEEEKQYEIPVSFLESDRNSERSLDQSNFGDQSSIQNQSEAGEDLIGFVISLSERLAIGIKEKSSTFLLFQYSDSKKGATSKTELECKGMPVMSGSIRQAIQVQSAHKDEVFIVTAYDEVMNVFQVAVAKSGKVPASISFVQQLKVPSNCICPSLETYCFYIAFENKIRKAMIDMTSKTKITVFKHQLEIDPEDPSLEVTAMVYTLMKESEEDDSEVKEYIAVATTEFNLIVLEISPKEGCEILFIMEGVHQEPITQIVTLTDNYCTLHFVTLSLDQQIHIISLEGDVKSTNANGQILAGLRIPSKKDFYVISTVNDETGESKVELFRRHMHQATLYTSPQNAIVDFKLDGNQLFFPVSDSAVDRITLQ